MTVSLSELPDIFSEIDEVYKSIIKYELIIDAIRNTVSKDGFSPEEEEHVMLALNPSEIGKRELEAMGIADEENAICKLPKRKIPTLKRLVEKELNETFDLIEKLENATKDIDGCEVDITSKVAELQMAAAATSDDVHNLCKRLKILLGLHVTDRTSCLKKPLETLTLKVSEIARGSSESEDAILRRLFRDATNEQLADIERDLRTEMEAVAEECDLKEKKLKNYEAVRAQLMPLAAILAKINHEIEFRKVALQIFSD